MTKPSQRKARFKVGQVVCDNERYLFRITRVERSRSAYVRYWYHDARGNLWGERNLRALTKREAGGR